MKTDIQLEKEIWERLQWALSFNINGVKIKVKNGEAFLSGTIDTLHRKITAENAAMTIAGIRSVNNGIKVEIPEDMRRSDGEIRNAILSAVIQTTSGGVDNIRVMVEDGFVTLEGEVAWEYERSRMRDIVEHITGVRGLSNFITVISSFADAGEVKRQIVRTFMKDFGMNVATGGIDVKVEEGRAILSGTVNNLAEKRTAERAAWLVQGITSVINELAIETALVD